MLIFFELLQTLGPGNTSFDFFLQRIFLKKYVIDNLKVQICN